MKIYRKKPLEIEAVQFDGTEKSVIGICKLNLNQPSGSSITVLENPILQKVAIVVNSVNVEIGDWVVREGSGFSVYPSDAFEIAFSRQVVVPTAEQFEAIVDLRPYLTGGRTDRTIDCLHYLGDDAQHWWEDRRKLYEFLNKGKEAIETLKEKDKELALLNLENKVYLYAKAANVQSLK